MLDYFNYYLLPLAIKIGMTPQQFWEDDPQDFWAYLDAYEQKIKDDINFANKSAYNQGCYFLLALRDCLQFTKNPKPIYPKKPFSFEEKKKLTQEEIGQMRKARFLQLEKMLNKE